MKPESMTFEGSAGRAVTPQKGQIGARPTSASSPTAQLLPGFATHQLWRTSIVITFILPFDEPRTRTVYPGRAAAHPRGSASSHTHR
jgi:hypothetical protein